MNSIPRYWGENDWSLHRGCAPAGGTVTSRIWCERGLAHCDTTYHLFLMLIVARFAFIVKVIPLCIPSQHNCSAQVAC